MINIKKSFGPVHAVKSGQITIETGEILALMGENGAGKSTLMNILSGSLIADEGQIMLNGKTISLHSPMEAMKEGIVKIHQELQLVPEMTISENMFLGREPLTKFGLVDYKRMNKKTDELLSNLNLKIDPMTQIKDLRVGEMQLVEIAKAMSMNASLLIMDEPTSALSESEAEKLFKVVKELSHNNVAIIYITHRMEEVFELTNRVTVMRDGEYIETVETKDTNKDALIKLMVGRDMSQIFDRASYVQDEILFSVRELFYHSPLDKSKFLLEDISFELKKGEILGIAGLMGAGRTELFEAIYGLHSKQVRGEFKLRGKSLTIRGPKDALNAGIAFVTEDRKEQGLVLGRSIGENITLPRLKSYVQGAMINRKQERKDWEKQVEALRIKTPSPDAHASSLSGGNQQKIVLARWLLTNPTVLLLDEPTRGIDVGARGEIYNLINEFAQSGMGVIVISSELPEVIGLSDRILTFCEGRLTGEFVGEDMTQENLMHAATLRNEVS
jgi:ABC-type sugar transport system ATPase subunit